MDDDALTQRLRRYRPVGPRSELRGRVLSQARLVRRAWPWAIAAAALLAATVGLRVSTEHRYRAVADSFPEPPQAAWEELRTLREAGLDELALWQFEMMRAGERVERPLLQILPEPQVQ